MEHLSSMAVFLFSRRRNHMKNSKNNADNADFSTSGTLRESLESLKDEPDFLLSVKIGGETNAEEGDV
jgi:hypothetical protein